MEWEKIVGANIKRLRKERGLSQEALAGEAGLAMRHLGRIERGEGNPTVAVLGKLADVLGVRPTEFYRVSSIIGSSYLRSRLRRS
jgi:transcriptional regulator with XRE-family HTH domain